MKKQIIEQNNTFQNQFKFKIDELNRKLNEDIIEIHQLKIQNKDNEINILNQNTQLKDKQIIGKDELIQQMERDFNDKKKKLQYQYEQSITLLEDKNLQDFQTLSKKPNSDFVRSIDYSTFDDEQFICSGSCHLMVVDIYVLDHLTKQFVYGILKHQNHYMFSMDMKRVFGVLIFHHYKAICSGSNDNTIRFWDIRSNKNELYMIKGNKYEDDGITCLKFLPLKKKEKENENKKNIDYDFKFENTYLKFLVRFLYKQKFEDEDNQLLVSEEWILYCCLVKI
ncbi:hypothetical protein RFI_37027 [Reticulomyxa filosa]|uniref:Uncharacterized protein n=1 Tax=Reticulomyxa filosa TaxID=46433 RepID=X6LIA3_RETFI|nr:hypothetical protein RFI_37027 [Reticulomyxa filosa]|eukprot:ETO00420.1 hypothetical protein RFI_37027 [Reticulomyxa filosa]